MREELTPRELYDRAVESKKIGWYKGELPPEPPDPPAQLPSHKEAPQMDVPSCQAWQCEECQELTDEPDPSPLYECGDCGAVFSRDDSADGCSNRCPECNKFGCRVGDNSCPECGSGPMREVTAYECPECGEVYGAREDAISCCAPPAESPE